MMELCPFCKTSKRTEKTITQNETMVFYVCGTTEVLRITDLSNGGRSHNRSVYKQHEACAIICTLRKDNKDLTDKLNRCLTNDVPDTSFG